MFDFDIMNYEYVSKYIVKAKNLINNKWVYGFYVPTSNESVGYIFADLIERNTTDEVYEVDSMTVSRCIGMSDRDDNPVFENDLVCLRISFSDKKPVIIIGVILERNFQWCVVGRTGNVLFALNELHSENIVEWNIEVLGNREDYERSNIIDV